MKSQKALLQCNFCGHRFARTIGPRTYEIKCPKCKEYDVEVIGTYRKTSNPVRLFVRKTVYMGKNGYLVYGGYNGYTGQKLFFEKESQAREFVSRIKAGEKPHKILQDIWKIKNLIIKPPPGFRYFDNRSTKSEAQKLGRWLEKQGWQVGIGKGKHLWHVFVKGKVNPSYRLARLKPTKHQMVINILTALYVQKIRLDPSGRPSGAGARKQYNKYMTLSVKELTKQNEIAVGIIGQLVKEGKLNPIGLAGILPEIGSGIVTGVGIGTGWTIVDTVTKRLRRK